MKLSVIIALLSLVLVAVGCLIGFGQCNSADSSDGSQGDNVCEGEHKWEFVIIDNNIYDGDHLIYECSECHLTKKVGVDEADHKFVIYNVIGSGDCQSVVYAVFKCSVCGWLKTMEGKFGYHEWTGSSTAFCGEEGYFERTCTICGEPESGTTLGLSHDLRYEKGQQANGVLDYEYCTRCDYTTYKSANQEDVSP